MLSMTYTLDIANYNNIANYKHSCREKYTIFLYVKIHLNKNEIWGTSKNICHSK